MTKIGRGALALFSVGVLVFAATYLALAISVLPDGPVFFLSIHTARELGVMALLAAFAWKVLKASIWGLRA